MNEYQSEIIKKLIEYVKDKFANEYSGHDFYHTYRVYKNSIEIAKKEGADEFLVAMIALLHDLDDVKLSPNTFKNKDKAREFMAKNFIDGDLIDKVCHEIDCISFAGSGKNIPATLEARCVQDADRLDAIGAIGIARAFSYGGSHKRELYNPEETIRENMTEKDYRKSESSSLNHFYEKLLKLKDLMNTDFAKKEALRRHEFMERFLKEFHREWEGSLNEKER